MALELGPENGCVTMGGRGTRHHNCTHRFLSRGHSQAEARTGRATPHPTPPPSQSIAGDRGTGVGGAGTLRGELSGCCGYLYPIS